MKDKTKSIITTVLGILLKDIIVAVIVSIVLGTFLCIIFWNFSSDNYIITLIGGFVGSLLSDCVINK